MALRSSMVIKLEGVEKCGVICIPDNERQNASVVFIVLNKNASKDDTLQEIDELIKKSTPAYYEPKEVVFLDTIPVTNSQKIDYQSLERIYNRI